MDEIDLNGPDTSRQLAAAEVPAFEAPERPGDAELSVLAQGPREIVADHLDAAGFREALTDFNAGMVAKEDAREQAGLNLPREGKDWVEPVAIRTRMDVAEPPVIHDELELDAKRAALDFAALGVDPFARWASA